MDIIPGTEDNFFHAMFNAIRIRMKEEYAVDVDTFEWHSSERDFSFRIRTTSDRGELRATLWEDELENADEYNMGKKVIPRIAKVLATEYAMKGCIVPGEGETVKDLKHKANVHGWLDNVPGFKNWDKKKTNEEIKEYMEQHEQGFTIEVPDDEEFEKAAEKVEPMIIPGDSFTPIPKRKYRGSAKSKIQDGAVNEYWNPDKDKKKWWQFWK